MDLRGQLAAGPGRIAASLVHTAAAAFDHKRAAALPVGRSADWTDVKQYGELAMRFRLDARGLELHGLCRDSDAGTVLASLDGLSLLKEPSTMLPAAGVIQALAPAGISELRHAEAAQRLATRMPLQVPIAVPPRSIADRSTNAGSEEPAPRRR